MNTELIQIGSSVYDIESYVAGLATKYFKNADGSLMDINTMRTGMFGWLTEAQSQLAFNSILFKSILYDEHFLNTAQLSESIYNFANDNNFDIFTCMPAYTDIYLVIPIVDIVKVYSANNNIFKISKDTIFSVKGINYILNNDVLINYKLDTVTGEKTVIVYYDTDTNFDIDDANYKIKSTYVDNVYIRDLESLMLNLRVYQLKKNAYNFNFVRTDVNELKKYKITIGSQLAAFNVYYKANKYADKIKLNLYPGDIPGDLTVDEKFCNYEYLNNSVLNIKFYGESNYFIPDNDSEIIIETYETSGTKGNFDKYTGDISVLFTSPIYQRLGIICRSLGPSVGGSDMMTTKEIKTKLLRYIQSKGEMLTESDLKYFIEDSVKKYGINSPFYMFKVRDDIDRRVFSIYLLVKDSLGKIYPTNTVDMPIHRNYLSTYFGTSDNGKLIYIPSGTYVIMRKAIPTGGTKYEYSDYKILPSDNVNLFGNVDIKSDAGTWKQFYMANPNKFMLFKTPYTMVINSSPILRINYYNSNITKTTPTKINNIFKNANKAFVISSATVSKNDFNDDTKNLYRLDFKISTNLQKELINKNATNCLTAVVLFYTINSDGKRVYYGFKDCTYDETVEKKDPYSFYSEFSLIPRINYSDKIILELFKINDVAGYYEPTNVLQDVELPSNVSMSILVSYNDGTSRNIYFDRTATDTINYSSPNLYDAAGAITGMNYVINVLDVSPVETINLFENMDNLMQSDVNIVGNNYVISKTPIIGNAVASSPTVVKSFNNIMSSYKTILESAVSNMVGNNSFDMKLYNTCGASKIFSLGETTIDLKLKVIMKSDVTTELDTRVRNHIVSFVNSINTDEVSKLSWSNLTTSLENTFKEIDNIQLISINNLIIYNITESINADRNGVNYVPEYLNIPFDSNGYKINITYENL